MADVDKALPNVEQTIKIPSPEELQVELEQTQKDPQAPVDVQTNEDGSVDINFDPSQVNLEQSQDHFSNLADLLPDNIADELSKLQDWKSGVVKALWVLFSGLIGVLGWIFSEAMSKF